MPTWLSGKLVATYPADLSVEPEPSVQMCRPLATYSWWPPDFDSPKVHPALSRLVDNGPAVVVVQATAHGAYCPRWNVHDVRAPDVSAYGALTVAVTT